MSGDASRTRQTLGMIQKQLSDTDLFEPSFSQRLLKFSRRRNRVVHGLFADSFKSKDEIRISSEKAQAYVKECEWVAREATQLVEAGFGIYSVLGEILRKSNPHEPKLIELLSSFEEFYAVGRDSIAFKFRPHLAPHDSPLQGREQ